LDKTSYSIALIPGDGIGNEVTSAAYDVALKAVKGSGATLVSSIYGWGTDYYFKHGTMMPPNAIETLRPHDAILAIPKCPTMSR
jgi:tartrate dehydrogenase/decarboxylase/D-malate dehydrogenase